MHLTVALLIHKGLVSSFTALGAFFKKNGGGELSAERGQLVQNLQEKFGGCMKLHQLPPTDETGNAPASFTNHSHHGD